MGSRGDYGADPRPESWQGHASYRSHFRNTILSYQGPEGDMPARHMYAPANTYAVANDHDYITTPQLFFLMTNSLKSISTTTRDRIEQETREQSQSVAWKQQRELRITSSRFGEICKATDRRDMQKLTNSLISSASNSFSSKATKHGILYEDVARQKYEAITGNKVRCSGLVISEEKPYLAASPDGVVGDVLLEIKCPYTARDKPITSATVPYIHEQELKKTHNYYYQVQGQLYCTGKNVCHFCVFTLQDFKVFTIKRDDEFISKMVQTLDQFYNQHYEKALLNKFVFKSYDQYRF